MPASALPRLQAAPARRRCTAHAAGPVPGRALLCPPACRQHPETLQRTELAYIPDRNPLSPAWLHAFGATEEYLVLAEHPL